MKSTPDPPSLRFDSYAMLAALRQRESALAVSQLKTGIRLKSAERF
jgi:hypothetical protein